MNVPVSTTAIASHGGALRRERARASGEVSEVEDMLDTVAAGPRRVDYA
jgi:hypothetical protein